MMRTVQVRLLLMQKVKQRKFIQFFIELPTRRTHILWLFYFLFSILIPPAKARFLSLLRISLSLDLAYNLHGYDLVPVAHCLCFG
jgi:hypothetical protein